MTPRELSVFLFFVGVFVIKFVLVLRLVLNDVFFFFGFALTCLTTGTEGRYFFVFSVSPVFFLESLSSLLVITTTALSSCGCVRFK